MRLGQALTARLDNGMPVVVVPRPGVGIATVAVAVATGSRIEPMEFTGHAHLLEHLLCADPDYVAGLEHLAGRFNASTRADRTVFNATVAIDGLPRLMHLEARRFASPVLGDAAVARQMRVVQAEVDARFHRRRHPRFPMAELRSLMFAEDRNRLDRVPANVAADPQTAAETVERYFASRYAPSQLALAIVGDVDPDQALRLAGEAWDEVPAREAEPLGDLAEPDPVPPQDGTRDGGQHVAVGIGFRAPAPTDLDGYLAMVVFAELVAECAVREGVPHLLSLTIGLDLTGDPLDVVGPNGLVARALVIPPTEPSAALQDMESLIRRTARLAATEVEEADDVFRTAQALLLSRMNSSLDDIVVQATLSASRLCDGGSFDLPEVVRSIRTMTRQDVAAAGNALGSAYRVILHADGDGAP